MKPFVILCFLLMALAPSAYAISTLAVNQNMFFGNIKYSTTPVFFKIDQNNNLQTNAADALNTGALPAIITLYGEPNETVSLTFGNATLVGASGSLEIQGITTMDGSNTVKLDDKGTAIIHLTGILNLNAQALQGDFHGSFTVWAHFNQQNNTVNKLVDASVILDDIGIAAVSQNLTFGTIYTAVPAAACTVTIAPGGGAVSKTGGCTLGPTGGFLRGIIALTGAAITSVTFPTFVNLTGGGSTLRLDTFKSQVTRSGRNNTVYVGGTLKITATSVVRSYSGTLNVTINN